MSFNFCPPFSKSASLPKFGLKTVLNHKKSENGYQIIRMDINYFFMQLLDSTPFCMMLDFSQVTLLSLCECKSTNCVLLFLVYYSIGVFLKHLFPCLRLTKYILQRHLNILSYTHLPPIMGNSYWWIPMGSNWSKLDFPAERFPLLPGALSFLGNFPVTMLILILLADKSLQNLLAFYLSKDVHTKARKVNSICMHVPNMSV